MKTKLVGFFTIAIIAICPLSQATPSGLTYLDSTWSSNEGEGGELIAINPNGTILASYHGDDIILFNTTTLESIGEFTFGEDIAGMEFNPNGSLLAINKRSAVTLKESIKLIDINSMEVLESSVLADDRFRDLSWSIDGKILAAQGNDGNGDVEQYHVPSLYVKNSLIDVHVVDVTCIDYRSDGQYLLTGDESGRWAVWNLQGELQSNYKTYSEGIIDCHFSPDGSDIVLLGENGKLVSKVFGGSEKYTENVEGAKQIIFPKVGNRMHLSVESDEFRGLLSYDYNSFSPLTNTSFFHKVEDVAFTENDYGRIQSLFVAGGTGEIAVYLRELIPNGFNQPGVDLDGDLVPDDLDPDDDGDGIIDDWDDDMGCDAPSGTPCSRYPDLDKIRSIEIYVGEKFAVSDQITLPTEDSSHIRNLSRNAVAKDNVISSSEAELFGNAMCLNMDHGDIIDKWRESIELSNGELGDATVSCSVLDGMELVRDGDSTTQITILITTTFNYSTVVSLPLDISLREQPLPADGSIAWLAPAHPISLTFKGDGVEANEISLWWNNEDDVATVTINQVSVKNPEFFEIVLELALNPFAFILYLGIAIGSVTILIRRSNRIEFDLDDDVEDSGEEEETEEFHEQDEISEIEFDLDDYEQEDITPSKRTPPPKKRKMYTTTEHNSLLVKKKRITTSQLNVEGPITKTKRKRLVAKDEDSQSVKDVAPIEAKTQQKIKTRKVKVEVPKSKPEKKNRKPVKRKTKKKNSDHSSNKESKESSNQKEDPVIDENELQGNLLNDFTGND